MLVETWLNEEEASFYNINNYQAVHCFREGRGGGASIYVKEGIGVQAVDKSNEKSFVNWVCVNIGESNLKLSAIYRPPSYSGSEFLEYFNNWLCKYPTKHVIVGYLNLNLLDTRANLIMQYKNMLILSGFKLHNTVSEEHATHVTEQSKSIIHHVLSTNNIDICHSITVEDISFSDHRLLTFSIKENINITKPKDLYEIKTISYQNFHYMFKRCIKDKIIQSFQDLINIIITAKKKSELTKLVRVRKNNKWINAELLELMKQKDKLYKSKKRKPDNIQLELDFKTIKNRINNKIKSLKNTYFKRKWEETGTNVKKRWNFVNSFFNDKNVQTEISSLVIDSNKIEDSKNIVQHLNQHFTKVGKNIVEELDNEIQLLGLNPKFADATCQNSIFLELTNEQEISEIISELKQNSAPGHDGVTARDIKNLKDNILKIILILFIYITRIASNEKFKFSPC
nr:unnamed protein product [Callosobruchus analis]